jgi:hypothetical protein
MRTEEKLVTAPIKTQSRIESEGQKMLNLINPRFSSAVFGCVIVVVVSMSVPHHHKKMNPEGAGDSATVSNTSLSKPSDCNAVQADTFNQCSVTFKQLYYNAGMIGESLHQEDRDNPACSEISNAAFSACTRK